MIGRFAGDVLASLKRGVCMSGKLWWLLQALLSLVACFFLFFGINLLFAAYELKNPFYFIMTFFASNLIILISVVLLIGFLYRMLGVFRIMKTRDN